MLLFFLSAVISARGTVESAVADTLDGKDDIVF